ncbi:ribosome-inactivating family protein [Streptomyces sp. NPDC050703]|uniref:ribosome-inactivating family protein n=1 Tax=Streptomyces sp. NPDC050703 TaxID=3157218 RepID=UPI003438EDA4
MGKIELSRRSFARIGAAVLAVPALGAVQGLAAPRAFANTNALWTDIDWHLEDWDEPRGTTTARRQAQDYMAVVDRMRDLASTPMAGSQGVHGIYDTTVRDEESATRRIIRVLLWSNASGRSRADVALYFSVDNLYLMGFSAHGHHYRFNASYTRHLAGSMQAHWNQTTPPIVTAMSSNGSYGTLSASPEWRGAQHCTSVNFLTHLENLENVTASTRNSQAVQRALAFFIGATSEAARFGWIETRIGNVLSYGHDPLDSNRPVHLGPFGAELENNWDTMSAMVHRTMQGNQGNPVPINGRTYRTWEQVMFGAPNHPPLGPFLANVGSV